MSSLLFDFSQFCFKLLSLELASSFLCLKSPNLFIFRFKLDFESQIFTVDSDFWNPLYIRGIIRHGGKFTLQFRGLKQQIQNQKCGKKGFVFMQKCVMTQTIICVKNNYILPCYKWAGPIRKIRKANAQPFPNFTILAHTVKANSPQGCFFNITPVLRQSRPETTWERPINVRWLILQEVQS